MVWEMPTELLRNRQLTACHVELQPFPRNPTSGKAIRPGTASPKVALSRVEKTFRVVSAQPPALQGDFAESRCKAAYRLTRFEPANSVAVIPVISLGTLVLEPLEVLLNALGLLILGQPTKSFELLPFATLRSPTEPCGRAVFLPDVPQVTLDKDPQHPTKASDCLRPLPGRVSGPVAANAPANGQYRAG